MPDITPPATRHPQKVVLTITGLVMVGIAVSIAATIWPPAAPQQVTTNPQVKPTAPDESLQDKDPVELLQMLEADLTTLETEANTDNLPENSQNIPDFSASLDAIAE